MADRQNDFEAMKKKMKTTIISMLIVIIAAIAGVVIYKNMH